MLMLQAPYPAAETTTLLPNPQFNDQQAAKLSLDIKRSMNGTKRTYVKSNGRNKLNLTFRLSRMKALELRAFVLSYFRTRILLTDHNGTAWSGYLISNPFEFEGSARAGGFPGGEIMDITLEFEGEKIS